MSAHDGATLPPERWPEVKAVVAGALECDPAERAAYLDRVCPGATRLRREVESLLAAGATGDFLVRSAIEDAGPDAARAVRNAGAADELRTRLTTALADRYDIGEELGGGGMARVFVGTERALHRRVVIKLFTPETAADLSLDRFRREIAFAARLQHANIVPLLSAGEADGLPYYTMPFVEGASLRRRLEDDGVMEVREAIVLLRDVARALAYAHAHGIVHRDVKPDNILIAGGAAVVTDFGIAKALSAARTAPGLPRRTGDDAVITRMGTTLGTPAYMAPEQGAGNADLDHHADVYSLGCTAYELLAGHPPFHGRPTHLLVAAHLTEPPPALGGLRPEVPPALARIIMRCLAKDPAARPSAAEVGRALDDVLPAVGVLTGAGSIMWAGATAPSRRRLGIVAGVLMLATAAVTAPPTERLRSWLTGADADVRTLAVLPLADLGGDTANAYFAASLADELTNALAKIDGLRVTPPGARGDAGRPDLRSLARTLGVATLLDGSVQRAGDRLRVRVRLVSGANGHVLWSHEYDNTVADILAVQADIADSVAASLRVTLRGEAQARVARAPGTRNAEAYLLYLQGRHAAAQYTEADLRRAIVLYEGAIARDSGFARAWAGMADAWVSLAGDFVAPETALVPARAAARRALVLDTTLAEAHVALGNVLLASWDAAGAARAFARAVALERNSAAAHYYAASALLPLGRHDEALAHAHAAHVLEPGQAAYLTALAMAHLHAGRPDSAAAVARRAYALDSTFTYAATVLGDALRIGGSPRDALDAYATRGPAQTAYDLVGPALARVALGQPDEARRAIREIAALGTRQNTPGDAIGMIHAHLGDRDSAFVWLERAYASRAAALVSLRTEPDWAPLRDDPRFGALVQRVGPR